LFQVLTSKFPKRFRGLISSVSSASIWTSYQISSWGGIDAADPGVGRVLERKGKWIF